MDFKLDRKNAVCSAVLLETEITQTAEHDFILPDYCPDIFRVLKCCIIPAVTSAGINGSRLTVEMSVIIRVLYRSPDSAGIYTVEHTLEFSKTVDLPADAVNPTVEAVPSTEYVNCRVADPRRLDVRGSVKCAIKVYGEKKTEIVCAAYGAGIQLRKIPVVIPVKRLVSAKRITVIEELELAAGKPVPGSILRCGTRVKKGEQKIITGKLITKGDAEISLLYLPKDAVGKPPESMRFSVPFSQIIDIEGIDSDFNTDVSIGAPQCSIIPSSNDNSPLECELILTVNVIAVKYESEQAAVDAYSTLYECECENTQTEVVTMPEKHMSGCSVKGTLSCADGEITQVYDLWCEGETVSTRFDETHGCTRVFGKVNFCMLGRLADGAAVYVEKECAYDYFAEEITDVNEKIKAQISVTGSSYTLGEGGAVKPTAELEITLTVQKEIQPPVLGNVTILDDKPKTHDKRCAVKLCFTDGEEELWDIAKKYSVSAQAISDENPADESGSKRVLLIPMKN